MKFFEEPVVEVLNFSVVDVITTSTVTEEDEMTYDPQPCF